jgi:SAM-dependent methyltransferase
MGEGVAVGIDRTGARSLAKQYLDRNDPVGWFEALYVKARAGAATIPWADMVPNPSLLEWLDRKGLYGAARPALKIGCGLGDDAEELARRGYTVTAFDVSKTAVRWCKSRFPCSIVRYIVTDLFHPPGHWERSFDFVLESYTLQVLPLHVRSEAIRKIAHFVSPDGTLLVICRARDEGEGVGEMPWPLTREDLEGFVEAGLDLITFEDYMDAEDPPVRRYRAEFTLTGGA